jgi:hypothetical protein
MNVHFAIFVLANWTQKSISSIHLETYFVHLAVRRGGQVQLVNE